MTTQEFCANCDNAADVRLTITEKIKKPPKRYELLLCSQCHDAFEWGVTHGSAGDRIEDEVIENEEG